MKLDPLVAQIIAVENFNHFTTSDVRSAYLALKNDPSLDPNSVRRNNYAELLKLVKRGWLNKKSSNIKGLTRFSKTDLFDVSNLSVNNYKPHASPTVDHHQHLLTKLKHYKAELLLNIGESEAYKELYSEFPELVDDIQPQYNAARDNNTKILGKIKAIESLLSKEKKVERI
ncbi:MAG: hypothetical protein P8I03_09170 [Thalassotalea sp.]|nr:hypothetical protein [Thalassotalea sp.]